MNTTIQFVFKSLDYFSAFSYAARKLDILWLKFIETSNLSHRKFDIRPTIMYLIHLSQTHFYSIHFMLYLVADVFSSADWWIAIFLTRKPHIISYTGKVLFLINIYLILWVGDDIRLATMGSTRTLRTKRNATDLTIKHTMQ